MFSSRESSDTMALSAITRRSSRARTSMTQPPTNSSGSPNPNSRGERSTRSNHNRVMSPQRSSTHRSQSNDDTDSTSKNRLPHTRQRQRIQDEDRDDRQRIVQDEDEYDYGEEEEEVTRCLCRQQEYPGLPPSRRESLSRARSVQGQKDEGAQNPPAGSSGALPEEIGSMFIQCDICKVWQHGGCVGIMDEAMSPDEYFCEECRKDLHKIRSEPNG